MASRGPSSGQRLNEFEPFSREFIWGASGMIDTMGNHGLIGTTFDFSDAAAS
jgi:hypothetical protein